VASNNSLIIRVLYALKISAVVQVKCNAFHIDCSKSYQTTAPVKINSVSSKLNVRQFYSQHLGLHNITFQYDSHNYYIIIIRISHFSVLAGRYSPILGCIINRIRLGGLMCNLGNFLQLNMCQELPLFEFVYYYYYYYYYYYVVSCHRPFIPGYSLEPAVIPTAQVSSFRLQYFPYYVRCS
jgi:hypothetical protein